MPRQSALTAVHCKVTHQLVEVGVVNPCDLVLVAERGGLLVLEELYCGQTGAGKGKLHRVAPDFALVRNTRLGIEL
jgi:hypothetical protein